MMGSGDIAAAVQVAGSRQEFSHLFKVLVHEQARTILIMGCNGLKHPAMPTQSQSLRKAGIYQCDLNHIARFEPVLSSQHQNVMHASFAGR